MKRFPVWKTGAIATVRNKCTLGAFARPSVLEATVTQSTRALDRAYYTRRNTTHEQNESSLVSKEQMVLSLCEQHFQKPCKRCSCDLENFKQYERVL